MTSQLYYTFRDGQQAGPFTFSQLQSMWRTGNLTAETLYCTEGMAEWKPLLEIASRLDDSGTAPTESVGHDLTALQLQTQMKSVGLAAALSMLLWPFGCLYASRNSFVLGFVSSIIIVPVAFHQEDPQNYLWIVVLIYIATVFATINAAANYNRKLVDAAKTRKSGA